MIGPVVKTDAQVARAGGQLFAMLPSQIRLALLVFGLLFAFVACGKAWLDYQDYVPSPNVCRRDQVVRAQEVGCVPPQDIPTPTGWQR